ncbi:MAG: hypothetical protein OXK78_13435 [Caldilineaceae bacterium]|nr:hypothetical protein [Caldilineaceae bacterium]
MNMSRGWAICAVILATAIGATSIFYPDWSSFISESGWLSLAFWIPLSIFVFWGGIGMWSFLTEATNKWIVPHMIHLLHHGTFKSIKKNR